MVFLRPHSKHDNPSSWVPMPADGPYLLGALQVPGQVHQQVMGDGVHQVKESHIPVEDVSEKVPFKAQVL